MDCRKPLVPAGCSIGSFCFQPDKECFYIFFRNTGELDSGCFFLIYLLMVAEKQYKSIPVRTDCITAVACMGWQMLQTIGRQQAGKSIVLIHITPPGKCYRRSRTWNPLWNLLFQMSGADIFQYCGCFHVQDKC